MVCRLELNFGFAVGMVKVFPARNSVSEEREKVCGIFGIILMVWVGEFPSGIYKWGG